MHEKIKVHCPVCIEERWVSIKTFLKHKSTSIICNQCGRYIAIMKEKSCTSTLELFGCVLEMDARGRCKSFEKCENYLMCLNEVEKVGWMGWHTI